MKVIINKMLLVFALAIDAGTVKFNILEISLLPKEPFKVYPFHFSVSDSDLEYKKFHKSSVRIVEILYTLTTIKTNTYDPDATDSFAGFP